jgi:hypothetical protein
MSKPKRHYLLQILQECVGTIVFGVPAFFLMAGFFYTIGSCSGFHPPLFAKAKDTGPREMWVVPPPPPEKPEIRNPWEDLDE